MARNKPIVRKPQPGPRRADRPYGGRSRLEERCTVQKKRRRTRALSGSLVFAGLLVATTSLADVGSLFSNRAIVQCYHPGARYLGHLVHKVMSDAAIKRAMTSDMGGEIVVGTKDLFFAGEITGRRYEMTVSIYIKWIGEPQVHPDGRITYKPTTIWVRFPVDSDSTLLGPDKNCYLAHWLKVYP